MNRKTEASMDLLADIMPSVSRLFADRPLLVALLKGNRAEVIRIMTAEHKEDTVNIIARVKGLESEEYEASAVGIFSDLMTILANKELTSFFASWGRSAKTSAGVASQNTEEKEQTPSSTMSGADGASSKRKSRSKQNS